MTIGDRVFLNEGVRIACSCEVRIGDGCQIGDESVILDNDFHAEGEGRPKIAPIILEEDVWLATRVIVLRGVTIGEGERRRSWFRRDPIHPAAFIRRGGARASHSA